MILDTHATPGIHSQRCRSEQSACSQRFSFAGKTLVLARCVHRTGCSPGKRIMKQNYERLAIGRVNDGTLSIDNDGRIWRHFRFDPYGVRWPIATRRAELQGVLQYGKPGYFRVYTTSPVLQRFSVLAHRLVWQCFFGDIPEDREINHRDGIKTRNHPSNLELVSHADNNRHCWFCLGKATLPAPKLTAEKVIQIRQQYHNRNRRVREIAEEFNVSSALVCGIATGKFWQGVGGIISQPRSHQ